MKQLFAVLTASVAMVGISAAPAAANHHNVDQDGLVNVAIGDITIQDINVGVAAQIAANVCGVQVGPVVLLAQRVDATSTQRTVCRLAAGDVTITQN